MWKLPTEPNTVSHPTFFTPRVGALRAPTQGKNVDEKARARRTAARSRLLSWCYRDRTAPAPPYDRTAPRPHPATALPRDRTAPLRHRPATALASLCLATAPRLHLPHSASPPPRDCFALLPGCTVPPARVLVCALAGGAVAPGCQVTRSAPSSSPAVPLTPFAGPSRVVRCHEGSAARADGWWSVDAGVVSDDCVAPGDYSSGTVKWNPPSRDSTSPRWNPRFRASLT